MSGAAVMGPAPTRQPAAPSRSQVLELAGATVMLLALTSVAFTAPFQTLAPDQRAAYGLALGAAAIAFALSLSAQLKPVHRPEPLAADATLLLAQLAAVWLLLDRHYGDLLATATVAPVPVAAATIAVLVRHATRASRS